MKKKDFYSSTLWFVVGLIFLLGGLKLGVGRLHEPGPGLFALIVGGLLSILSICLFTTTALEQDTRRVEGLTRNLGGSSEKMLLSFLALVFFIAALDQLGYIITTFLFVLFLLKVVSKKGWWPSIALGILLSLLTYSLFKFGLGVPLPRGIVKIG